MSVKTVNSILVTDFEGRTEYYADCFAEFIGRNIKHHRGGYLRRSYFLDDSFGRPPIGLCYQVHVKVGES